MKKIFARIGEIVGFFILLIAVLIGCGKILLPKWLSPKDNYVGYIARGYKAEPDNSIDILFVGNSDVYRAITPLELYEQQGIASYINASPGQRLWTSYYVIEDALKTQHPDIIFYNMDAAFSDNDSAKANYCKAFGSMGWSDVKTEALFDKNFGGGMRNRIDMMVPVIKFHSRATSLEKEDFTKAFGKIHFPYKGYALSYIVKPYSGKNYMVKAKKKTEFSEKGKSYMDKIVQICKDNNIKLVLMETPSADSWNMTKHDITEKYAKENGLDFLDMNMCCDDMNFDWSKDTSDAGDHLNVYGAKKVTKYLGKYIINNFEVKDHRDDESYQQWNEDLEIYKDNIQKKTTL